MVHWRFWAEPEPPGPDETIYTKWRNEIILQAGPVLVLFIVCYIWFLLMYMVGQLLLGVLPGFFSFSLYAVLWLKIRDSARDKYGQYKLCKETVHESATKHWRDYFALQSLERLNPNDRRVQAAAAFMAKLRARRKEIRLRQQPLAQLPGPTGTPAPPAADPPAPPPAVFTPEPEDFVVTLATFAFRAPDDPWRQQLWITDVDANLHLHAINDTAYIGNIGIRGPVHEFSVAWTGEGIAGVPLCVFVESPENIQRIQAGLDPLRANPVTVTRAAELHDFWLSIELVQENQSQDRRIASLEGALDFYRKMGGKEAEQFYQMRKRYDKVPGLKLDRALIWRVAKYAIAISITIAALWVAWNVAALFLGPILFPGFVASRGGVEPPSPRQGACGRAGWPAAAPSSAPEGGAS
jgi:hypothetical protein